MDTAFAIWDGRYWVGENTATGHYFTFGRQPAQARWVKNLSDAGGFSKKWAVEWAMKGCGVRVVTAPASARIVDTNANIPRS